MGFPELKMTLTATKANYQPTHVTMPALCPFLVSFLSRRLGQHLGFCSKNAWIFVLWKAQSGCIFVYLFASWCVCERWSQMSLVLCIPSFQLCMRRNELWYNGIILQPCAVWVTIVLHSQLVGIFSVGTGAKRFFFPIAVGITVSRMCK